MIRKFHTPKRHRFQLVSEARYRLKANFVQLRGFLQSCWNFLSFFSYLRGGKKLSLARLIEAAQKSLIQATAHIVTRLHDTSIVAASESLYCHGIYICIEYTDDNNINDKQLQNKCCLLSHW